MNLEGIGTNAENWVDSAEDRDYLSNCYYGDDMEEHRRLCRWEDNIKKDLKQVSM